MWRRSRHIREGRRNALRHPGRGVLFGFCARGSLPDGRPRSLYPSRCWDRGSGKTLRRTNAGPVRRGDSDRTTIPRGQAKRRGAHKPVANGGIVAEELSDPGSNQGNRGHLGTGGSCIGRRVRAARCPRSFGPLLQSIPRPWGVMEYRNGLGATTPTSAAEGAARQDRVDLALRRTPGATVRGRRGVFPCGFPHLV